MSYVVVYMLQMIYFKWNFLDFFWNVWKLFIRPNWSQTQMYNLYLYELETDRFFILNSVENFRESVVLMNHNFI